MNSIRATVCTLYICTLLASPVLRADSPGTGADRQCGGESCAAVFRGLFGFFDRNLHGLDANGRSCNDCHMATDHFQLSPANAERRYQRLQQRRVWDVLADDPLFRPIDADDFPTNGIYAEDYTNLRQNGLIRIRFQMPGNIKVIDPVTQLPSSETEVWRMVPSVLNTKLTGPDGVNPTWPRGPNPTGGYQLDGRFNALQEQALGALTVHAEVQNPPPQRLLDDLTAFQRTLFSNFRVRALADAIDAGTVPLPDPDPPLNALEQQGKVVFVRACTQCHGGPGQSTPQVPKRFHDISTQCPRPVDTVSPPRFSFKPCPPRLAANARTYLITLASGATLPPRVSSDPGRALLTGYAGVPGVLPADDDWNKLDMPSLRGIKDTAPYFHNNSADTLEEVLDHYDAFFKRVFIVRPPNVVPPVLSTDGVNFDRPPVPEERAALLAYLRKL
jgi:cytochrome c peroxidase